MIKKIIIKTTVIIACLCLMVGTVVKSHAGPPVPLASQTNLKEQMNKHIEKVKIKNPKKYQEMVERTGGNITGCIDCHIEVAKDKKSMSGGK